MTYCDLLNFDFLHLAICLLCFLSCFCESYNTIEEQGKQPIALSKDPNDDEIVFRIIHGRPAKLGQVPYQVRNLCVF